MPPRIGPVRIVLAVLIFAGGVAGFLVFLLTRLAGFTAGLDRIPAPGSRELALEAGPHTVYWETAGAFFGPGWPGLECSVRSKETGAPADLSRVIFRNEHYSTTELRGTAVIDFTIDRPGVYVVQSSWPSGKSGTGGTIAVRRGRGLISILVTVLGCLVLLGGSIGAGVALLLCPLRKKA